MTLRQYARREGITIGAAYMRAWNDRIPGAELINGRWIIKPEPENTNSNYKVKDNEQ